MDIPAQDRPAPSGRPTAIWDLPTRLFHWVQALLFVALWITGDNGQLDWHMRIGEALLAMLVFRIAWGFVGSRHSRFADFVAGWRRAGAHLREVARVARRGPAGADHASPHAGHTPLGGWMILALLFLMILQCVTGLFATDDIFTSGPLNHLVGSRAARILSVTHSTVFDVILALVAAHIAAALFYLLRKRENLIRPLITGRAMLPEAAADQMIGGAEARLASPWRAVLVFVLAAALVRAVISL